MPRRCGRAFEGGLSSLAPDLLSCAAEVLFSRGAAELRPKGDARKRLVLLEALWFIKFMAPHIDEKIALMPQAKGQRSRQFLPKKHVRLAGPSY